MSTAIAAVFTPGINQFWGMRTKMYAPKYSRVFNVVPMSGRLMMQQDLQLYGPPQVTLPLNAVHMDEVRQSFNKGYTPIKRTLGDIISEEDWEDDPYGVLKRVIPARSGAMGESFEQKREYDCANYLAVTAYSTSSPVPGSPDGVSLLNSAHPISLYNSGTTVSNVTSSPVALSHTVYYAAYSAMSQQLMPNNYTIMESKPATLICNPAQRAVAFQLVKGDFERASGTQAFQGLMNAAKEDTLDYVEWAHYRKTLSTSAANSWDGWVLLGPNHRLTYADRTMQRARASYDENRLGYFWVAYTRYDIGHGGYRDVYGTAN